MTRLTSSRHRTLRPLAVITALAALTLALFVPGQAEASHCTYVDADPDKTSQSGIEDAVRCLINRKRKAQGKSSLNRNDDLTDVARGHSEDMEERNYFSHKSPEGKDAVDRIRATGYLSGSSSWRVGENIAWGSGSYSTPRSIVNRWMDSSGHRANILGSFRDIGVGVALGAPKAGVSDAATYTADFGRR